MGSTPGYLLKIFSILKLIEPVITKYLSSFQIMYHQLFFNFSGATAAAAAAAAAAAGTEGFGVPDEMDDHDMGRLQGTKFCYYS